MLSRNTQMARHLAALATQCLLDEADLTPKPGLVDRRGSGSHTDLNLALMQRSALSLQPTFEAIAESSWLHPVDVSLRQLIGQIGREGEVAMMRTTKGVNTHRGAIWTLGLLTAAIATLGGISETGKVAAQAAALARLPDMAVTQRESHGLRVKQLYQVPGAKEEAQAGFPHITRNGLPELQRSRAMGFPRSIQELNALLSIMSTLTDTCVLSRGGMPALRRMNQGAKRVLALGGAADKKGAELFQRLDRDMKQLNVSPGGAADLLAGTFFMDRLSQLF